MSHTDNSKVCSKCKFEKSYNNFRKDKSKLDGYYPSCNDCYRQKYKVIKGGKKPKLWKWRTTKAGYLSTGTGIRQHRYVMEQHLGYKLESWQHVHHINHNKTDNRLENLVVLSVQEHRKIHPGRERNGTILSCTNCGKQRYYSQIQAEQVSKTQYRCMACYKSVRYRRSSPYT
jgi:hypothetical protein